MRRVKSDTTNGVVAPFVFLFCLVTLASAFVAGAEDLDAAEESDTGDHDTSPQLESSPSSSKKMYVPDNICYWNDSVPQNELLIVCHCDGYLENDYNSSDFNCWIVSHMHDEDAIWDSFARQKKLTTLTFNLRQDGTLSFIPRKALQHMANIKLFKVNHASIPRIRTRDFAGMHALNEIKLSACEIKKLDKQAFYNLTSLQTLELSHNRIDRIKKNVFHLLPQLEKLYLDRNGLKELEPGCFKELTSLVHLELWKNEISNLTDKTFKNLRKLEKLDLSQNMIEYIPNYPFQDLENLKELNLDDNSVRFVDEFAFFGLTKLVTLHLQDNKLVNLGQGLFYYTPSLMVLDLRQNVLETLQFHTIENLASNFNNASFTLILKGRRDATFSTCFYFLLPSGK
jgi:Leucine-rich repeat (LRR) protein